MKNIFTLIIFCFYFIQTNAQQVYKPFEKEKVVQLFSNSEVKIENDNDWVFTFIDPDNDSTKLSSKRILFEENGYISSEVYKLEDDSSEYNDKFVFDISKKQKFTLESLNTEYDLLGKKGIELGIKLIGFIVSDDFVKNEEPENNNDINLTIIDENDNPISFVEIGVSNKNIGFISNEKGEVFIKSLQINKNDFLQIFRFGYKQKEVKISEIKNNSRIQLKKENLIEKEIEEVVINGKKIVYYEEGLLKTKSNVSGFVASGNIDGSEVGKIFSIDKPIWIKSFSVNVSNLENKFKFMGRIYTVENNTPKKVIVEKIIESDIKKGWVEFILEKPIKMTTDFFVGIKWIDTKSENPGIHLGKRDKSINLQRSKPFSSWIKSKESNWGIKIKYHLNN
jgi:hypothetical protein